MSTKLLERRLNKEGVGSIFYIANQEMYGEPDKLAAGVYRYSPQGLGDPSDMMIHQSDSLNIGRNVQTGNDHYSRVKSEVSTLVTKREWFTKLQTACRRGILLYGPAGTGKTTIQKEVINNLIKEFDAIVVETSVHEDLDSQLTWVDNYRTIHNDASRPVIFSFSDLNAAELRSSTLTNFRNFLERYSEFPTIVFATTNEFERLDLSLSNRPGRFDSRILIEALAFPAFEAICDHYYLKEFAPAIFKLNPFTTPALLKEMSIRINCFNSKPYDAIESVLSEFAPDGVYAQDDEPKAKKGPLTKMVEELKASLEAGKYSNAPIMATRSPKVTAAPLEPMSDSDYKSIFEGATYEINDAKLSSVDQDLLGNDE